VCTGDLENGTYRCFDSIDVVEEGSKVEPVRARFPFLPLSGNIGPNINWPPNVDQEERIYNNNLEMARRAVCAGVPDALVSSVSITAGGIGAAVLVLDIVYNLNTGNSTQFVSTGIMFGLQLGAEVSLSTSAVYNIGANNSNFGGGNTGVSVSIGAVAAQVSVSSAGLSALGDPAWSSFFDPANGISVQLSGEAGPAPRIQAGVTLTNSISQSELGAFNPFANGPFESAVAGLYGMKQWCKSVGALP
jgi:hypothetical protein